jgi:hypothetical protein
VPVIDLAAVVAQGLGRRRHDAHVAQLEVLEQHESQPVVLPCDFAPCVQLLLAISHDRGLPPLDLPQPLQVRQGSRQPVEHPGGDVGLLLEDEDESPLAGKLVRSRLRQEPVLQVVVLGGRVALDGAMDAVVIGEQEAVGGDEGSAAPLHAGDRTEQPSLTGCPEVREGDFEAALAQSGFVETGEVVPGPHAFTRRRQRVSLGVARASCGSRALGHGDLGFGVRHGRGPRLRRRRTTRKDGERENQGA